MDRAPATARALALLAALTSPVFMGGAVVAWVMKLWPATPVTFAVAAVAVLGGPLLGLAHARGAREEPPAPAPPPAPPTRPAPPRPVTPMTAERARSLAFLAWRDHPPRYLQRLRSRAVRRTVSPVRPEPRHDHLA
ncbi:MAG TPA: hypothetical protein VH418_21080 [Solirubrobacteraceae bacterium]|jgi:hypothetical protein